MPAHRVLIVDDEAALRRALRVGLAAKGFEVMEAGNGNEALTIIAAEPCDAVLMDVNMPELDGIEACRPNSSHPARASDFDNFGSRWRTGQTKGI